MIRFNCENCGQKFKLSDRYAGRKSKCPKCKQPIVIPPAGEESAQQSSIIKFRCPSCNQKIGVTPDYAGKRVRCSKCKNPLRVPQASSQPGRLTVKDEKKVLRAGQEQHSADGGIWDDLGGLDELRLAEANAPSVERQMESNGVDYESGDSELSAYTGRFPQSGAYVEREISSDRPKKKHSTIFIGAACVLVLLLVGIIVWSIGSDSESSESEIEARLHEVQKFAADYIGLLSEGEIDKAKALLSPELKIDVQTDEIERFSEQIGKGEIIQLDCNLTHFQKHPEGEQIFLWYNLRYKDTEQLVIISIMAIDEELRVEGISAQELEPFGAIVSIGQINYEELADIVIGTALKELGPIFKFFGAFLIVAIVLGLIQTVSMWVVFNKAGHPGWAAIVPIYNMWVLAEVGDKPGWLGLLACFGGAIPFIGPIVVLVLWAVISIGVARAFDRGVGFGIGLTIIPFVFYPILAFVSD